MEQDEAGTLAAIKALREEAIDPLLAEHKGRIVKLMGDGAIFEFACVVDAVACAVGDPEGMAEREAAVPEAERIRFRIGVNLGDVIVEGEDIYGDGVNVAARLEQLAEPGGVVVSGTAFDHLQGGLGRTLRPPRRAAASRTSSGRSGPTGWSSRRSAGGPSGAGPRPPLARQALARGAAVREPERRCGAGLLRGRDHRGRHHRPVDAFGPVRHRPQLELRLPGQGCRRRQVGRELGVRYVLEGSFSVKRDRVRVTAQLVDVATGAHIWSERWERSAADVFAVQTEIAEQTANLLAGEGVILHAAAASAMRTRPEDLTAYESTCSAGSKRALRAG